MPVITLAIHPTDDQIKARLIRSLTDTAAEITKIPQQSFVVLIQELEGANIGVGGTTLAEIKKK